MLRSIFLLVLSFACVLGALAQDSVTVMVEKAAVHSSPDAKSKVIATVDKSDVYKRIKQQGLWSKIKVGKRTGWIDNNSIVTVAPVLKDPEYANGVGSGGGVGEGRGSGVIGQGQGIGRGYGSGNGTGTGTGAGPPVDAGPLTPMRLISKPRPLYTDAARKNNVQGIVTLRITFLANGNIGSISAVQGLPFGLTEEAMAAARKITFEPAKRQGVPVTVTKLVQFSFALY